MEKHAIEEEISSSEELSSDEEARVELFVACVGALIGMPYTWLIKYTLYPHTASTGLYQGEIEARSHHTSNAIQNLHQQCGM